MTRVQSRVIHKNNKLKKNIISLTFGFGARLIVTKSLRKLNLFTIIKTGNTYFTKRSLIFIVNEIEIMGRVIETKFESSPFHKCNLIRVQVNSQNNENDSSRVRVTTTCDLSN